MAPEALLKAANADLLLNEYKKLLNT